MGKNKIERYQFQNGGESIQILYPELRKIVLTLRSVEHELRKNIIELLWDNDKMTVTQVYVKLRVEQSVASQHLAILRRSGIVKADRDGKYIHYSLNKERLTEIGGLIEQLAH
jgi:DNA-binding transcriptional ArsR family regulator